MAKYQSNLRRMVCHGMNLNRPIDAIPEYEYAYLRNVRSYVEGRIEGRPGTSQISTFTSTGGSDYINSGYTLNDFNPDSSGGSNRFIGYNTGIYFGGVGYVGVTFSQIESGFSGNPLSMVPSTPDLSTVPWLYVADSNKLRKYSSSYLSGGVPVSYTVGIPQPWVRPTSITTTTGPLTGSYYYRYQFEDQNTGVISQPGPPTWSTVDLVGQSAILTMPSANDPGGNPYLIGIYRFGGAVAQWKLVGTALADGATTFTDTVTDTVAQSALTLDDSRFQPFISQDITHKVTASIAAASQGTGVGDGNGSIISGSGFNSAWLPGTPINVSGGVQATLLRWISSTQIEVQEDLGSIGSATVLVIGALKAGQPLPYMWGPYGSGFTGLYFFACGDPRHAGTLYWTTGNDPDTTNPQYSLDICSPSEPLMNGCMWNGRVFVWSSERMWEIIPNFGVDNQFVAQELPGHRGLYANWCFATGDLIYFMSKDGIYECGGGGCESITDKQLKQFMQHDAQPGYTVTLPNPENFNSPITIQPPDPSLTQYWRMSYGDGNLYFDYIETNTSSNTTLTYQKFAGSTGPIKGWVLDNFREPGLIFRYWEDDYHSMLVGIANGLYQFTGVNDNGAPIICQVMTGADDLGQPRALKHLGDMMVDATTNGSNVIARVLGNENTQEISVPTNILSITGSRVQNIIDLGFGSGFLSRTVGLWLNWASDSQTVELYQYQPTYTPREDNSLLRATDYSTDGYDGSKFLKTVWVEANTFGAVRTFNVMYTGPQNPVGVVAGTFSIATNGKEEVPFAIVPNVVGTEFSIQPTDSNEWQLLNWGYGWDKYPEYLPINEDYSLDKWPDNKYVRGIRIEGDTLNSAVNFSLQYDNGGSLSIPNITQNGRTLTEIGFPTPFIASEIRLIPLGNWRKFSVTYIYDEYPSFAPIITSWSDLGNPGRKYIRGGVIQADTNNQLLTLTSQIDGPVNGPSITLTANGQNEIAFAFNPPVTTHLLRWLPNISWRYWRTTWTYDIYPELTTAVTSINDLGNPGLKFIQGFRLTADTAGLPVQFQVLYDGPTGVTQIGFTTPATAFYGKQTIAFSFPTPFLAHNVQIKPLAAAGIFDSETQWVWEPAPEYVTTWETQPTTHDIGGYSSLRDCFIAYDGSGTLTITTEYGSFGYNLPQSTGYTRLYLPLLPHKSKWKQYLVSGNLRVYYKDTSFNVIAWGGQNMEVHPFGDMSRVSGARI